jgi:hypothetical protein
VPLGAVYASHGMLWGDVPLVDTVFLKKLNPDLISVTQYEADLSNENSYCTEKRLCLFH